MLGQARQSGTNWNDVIGAFVNKSDGAAECSSYSTNASPGAVKAVPRLCGLLGGAGCISSQPQPWSPTLDSDTGFQVRGVNLGSASDWTWLFVWSRPNWRQNVSNVTSSITLLSVQGTILLQADGSGDSGRLVLFPGEQQTVLVSNLSCRHTHSILIRFSRDHGVDVWLDDINVATAASCVMPAVTSAPVIMLHDGTVRGSAQCWFHEAAYWQRAVSNAEVLIIGAYASRWSRGTRKGVSILVNGQSNAINYALNDGAAQLLAQGVAWHLGALAYNTVASQGGSNSYTMISGHGIYAAVEGTYPGDFVHDPGNNSDPTGWFLGADGNAVGQMLAGLSKADRSAVCAILWPWNETDSLRSYSEKATFLSAAKRFLLLERTMLGDTASDIPLIWWNAIPYGGTSGIQMHREVTAQLAADPTMNVVIGNPQTSDSNARGSAWDPHTGIASGGDFAHRDAADNRRFARSAAPVVARHLLGRGYVDTISAIPAGIPAFGGPQITQAYRINNTSVVLTVSHDAGNDLIVPLLASTGIGFAVMDGGSVSVPGNILHGASCRRLDATHLLIALDGSILQPSSQCRLFFPYGSTAIGRGNCVTDNYTLVAKPSQWDISSDLGSDWAIDYPLAATTTGIVLSDQVQ
jgi:hypothetical protein